MEGLDKKTVRILHELAANWSEASIPHKLLTMVADVLKDYFDQEPDWHLQVEDTDAQMQS